MDAAHEAQSLGDCALARRNAQAELKKLNIEAYNLGTFFQSLGQLLLTDPESVFFSQESWQGPQNARFIVDPSKLDGTRLKTLLQEIRKAGNVIRGADKVLEA